MAKICLDYNFKASFEGDRHMGEKAITREASFTYLTKKRIPHSDKTLTSVRFLIKPN